jgi:peptidoglycan hydrolase-like protein with peptidoglycan-binding domain
LLVKLTAALDAKPSTPQRGKQQIALERGENYMALKSQLFTTPDPDPQLEACLVSDPAHIMPGSRGDHVKKIQNALNRLSAGPGRENFGLKVDGWYGVKTAAAVKAYKNAPSRRILQPWQKTADDIVGKRTIKSLDDEMDILENELPLFSGLISPTNIGAPHDHKKCPTEPRVTAPLADGHPNHLGTPINPKGFGRKINIYGEGETDYLEFVDFATEPQFLRGRPLTSSLPDQCASDICMRSAPINKITHTEIKRLARPLSMGGCRFTYASNQITFSPPRPLLFALGLVIQQARLAIDGHEGDPLCDLEVWVIEVR